MKKLFVLATVFFVCGCAAAPIKTNKAFETYFDAPKTVAVLPPDIKIYQLSAGGQSELMDEWTADAKAKILDSINKELGAFRGVRVSLIDSKNLDEKSKDLLKEQTGLYAAVSSSILSHVFTPANALPNKTKTLDYTLGPEISAINGFVNADTLLFCTGTNYIWTAGRVCLSAFGTILGAATGVCVVPSAGPEWINLSLVDAKTGDVMWYDFIPMQGDLRNAEVDKRLIKRLFSTFPKKWRIK